MAEVDSAEFAEWKAFYQLEPWGGERDDYRAGTVAAAVRNSMRGPDTDPFHPYHFIETLAEEHARRHRPVEVPMADRCAAVFGVLNDRVLRAIQRPPVASKP